MVDYGTDISTFVTEAGYLRPQLDTTFALISGTRAVGEAIARRLITPRGALPYDPDYGFDLRAYVNDDFGKNELFALRSGIESEAEKDERVLSASATVSLNPSTHTLTIALEVTLADGPFDLVLTIDAVGVALLAVS